MKSNCWEFMECGRGPGGSKMREVGVCPAACNERLDGVHDGLYAGRACWIVSGTFCGGVAQGTFAAKLENCTECRFYKKVQEEEKPHFMLSGSLLGVLKRSDELEEDQLQADPA